MWSFLPPVENKIFEWSAATRSTKFIISYLFFIIDLRGKAPGRGAYLCPSAACLAKARKAKRLERTFEVPIPDGIYDRLTEEIACAEQTAKEAAHDE